ncbi:unnamed protein product, partial [Didymodactylos carnosus]
MIASIFSTASGIFTTYQTQKLAADASGNTSAARTITNYNENSRNNVEKEEEFTTSDGYLSHYTSVRYPGAGMIRDVKIRLPHYLSDWTQAVSYRILAATIRIYFLNAIPALAYTMDMYTRTHQNYGVNEALLSSALGGIVFGLFAVQPISIVGFTGLINLFNYTTYDIMIERHVNYLPFMCWIAIWSAIFHWLIAIFNIVSYVRYVTNFTAEIFGFYVGIVYIQKGIEFIINEFNETPRDGFMSTVIACGFFFTYWTLTHVGQSSYFTRPVRDFLADYAMIICVLFWSGFAYIPGNLRSTNIQKLPVTRAFFPTQQQRSWFVNPSDLDISNVFIALPFGLLVTALFYFDHNISSLTAQAKHYPLKKPAGFHWDFFVLGWTTLIARFLGLPYPNALVPQCAMHTDALGKWKKMTVDDEQHIPTAAPSIHSSRRSAETLILVEIKEQRLTNTLQGLLCIVTMAGPFLICFAHISRAVLAGVFIGIGWGSVEGNSITTLVRHLVRDPNHMVPSDPLLQLSRLKIFHYVCWMLAGFAVIFGISQTTTAVGFP